MLDPMNLKNLVRELFYRLEVQHSIGKNADKYYNLTEEQLSTTISLLLERSGYNTKNEPSNRVILIYMLKNPF
jgi:hypothetical protein